MGGRWQSPLKSPKLRWASYSHEVLRGSAASLLPASCECQDDSTGNLCQDLITTAWIRNRKGLKILNNSALLPAMTSMLTNNSAPGKRTWMHSAFRQSGCACGNQTMLKTSEKPWGLLTPAFSTKRPWTPHLGVDIFDPSHMTGMDRWI